MQAIVSVRFRIKAQRSGSDSERKSDEAHSVLSRCKPAKRLRLESEEQHNEREHERITKKCILYAYA